jgi:hypothetical protein
MAKINWDNVVTSSIPIFKDFNMRGVVPTLRTIYYALVSKEIIPNTKSAYKGLSAAFVTARQDGRIAWQWLADETRKAEGGDRRYYWDKDEYADALMRRVVNDVKDAIYNDNYNIPKWHRQPNYVEVWIEKAALQATFRKYLEDWRVTLVPSRGYSSWTFLKEGADRIRERAGEKKAKILYFGDFDPSGEDIERFITESLNRFPGVDVEVRRVCVSLDQINEYNLPAVPEDAEEIEKLQRDARFKNWEHGVFRVELDALLAIVPDEFERLVTEAVSAEFDQIIADENDEEEAESNEHIKKRIREELPAKIKEVIDKLGEEE